MKHPLHAIHVFALLLAYAASTIAADAAPKPSAPGGITEITLERTPCFGRCPVDKLVLHADGTAEYTGMENAPRKGQFTGKFPTGDFNQLAQWLITQGFFELQGSYGSRNIDGSSNVIRVTRGGEPRTVINYEIDHSLQVWGMENAILATAVDIPWQPVTMTQVESGH